MGYDVFVSHSSKDKPVADRAVAALESAGVRCWVAPRDISPGEEWAAGILRGIGSCRVMVLVFSAGANASPQVLREVERAVNRRVPVVPFKVDATLPSGSLEYFIMSAHWLDASRPPMESHLAELVRSTKALLAGGPAPGEAGVDGGAGPTIAHVTAPPIQPNRPGRPGFAAAAALLLVLAGGGVWAWRHRDRSGPTPVPVSPSRGSADTAAGTDPAADAPVPLPARLQGLAAAEVLSVAYGSSPPPGPVAVHPRLQAGIMARRTSDPAAGFVPLKDGNALASEEDDYVIAARALTTGHLYIFQVGPTGTVAWLFPKNAVSRFSTGGNPVAAGTIARVPAAQTQDVLSLDDTAGAEHVYFVFSAARWPGLEAALARTGRPAVATRGPGGGGEGEQPTAVLLEPNRLGLRDALRDPGSQHAASAAVDLAPLFPAGVPLPGGATLGPTAADGGGLDVTAAGSFVVAERWFRHVARP